MTYVSAVKKFYVENMKGAGLEKLVIKPGPVLKIDDNKCVLTDSGVQAYDVKGNQVMEGV